MGNVRQVSIIILDVFGRDYPRRPFFTVDRPAVVAVRRTPLPKRKGCV